MGYTVVTEDVSFVIPPANIEAALVALTGTSALRAAAAAEGRDPAQALIAAIAEHGFDAGDTPEGEVALFSYADSSRTQDEMVLTLAPFAEDGSYIEWRGEQDERWRDIIRDGKVYNQHPVITWTADPGQRGATPPALSTVIPTLYRDGHNNKVHGQIRLSGPITPTQIAALRAALDEGLYYAPADIGHTHLGGQEWPQGFPRDGVDHCWHEMDVDNTDIVATEDLDEGGDHIENDGTPEQFITAVTTAAASGWPSSTTSTN
jgi:hypothetical protein